MAKFPQKKNKYFFFYEKNANNVEITFPRCLLEIKENDPVCPYDSNPPIRRKATRYHKSHVYNKRLLENLR